MASERKAMVNQSSNVVEVLWYEGVGTGPVAGEFRFQVLQELLDRGYRVRRVAPNQATADASSLTMDCLLVLGNFCGRAPEHLETLPGDPPAVRDVHGLDVPAVLSLVEAFRGERQVNRPPSSAAGQTGRSWKPWFPVIDYERCTNCMQCLSFCLFDVYGVDEAHRIEVRNQDHCKTNCPACSRVCPEVAIMFPKYGAGPINGAPVSDRDLAREKMKVDISALLGGDIYANLRERSAQAKSRFSVERSPDKALLERRKCLAKLQGEGLIPASVLAEIDLDSLPGPEEIQQRAQAAAAKAEAARKARKEAQGGS